jgi:hypothetical protein
VLGLLSAPTVGAPSRGVALKISFPPAISMVIRTEYRSQRYSMGSSDPPPSRIRNPVREPEFPGHGERLPHVYHQPRRAPPVAVVRARTGSRHTCCCWRPGTHTSGRCGPVSTLTLAVLRSALALGAKGTTSGRARCCRTRRTCQRDDGHTRRGARGSRAAVPPRDAQCHGSLRFVRQHRRGGVQGPPWPPPAGSPKPHRHHQR